MSDFFEIVKCRKCDTEFTFLQSIDGYCPSCAIEHIKELEGDNDSLVRMNTKLTDDLNECRQWNKEIEERGHGL